MSRRSIITLLVGVNAVLLTTLIVTAWDLPQAQAQPIGVGTKYLMVSGAVGSERDAIYLIDLSTRTMFMFEVDRTTKALIQRDFRALEQDFNPGGVPNQGTGRKY